jgi:protocatechuate 3,4-dioxygenase beta subunit
MAGILAFAMGLPLAAQVASVAGRVTNQAGEPVKTARVTLELVDGFRPDMILETDASGGFAFTTDTPGRYRLRVVRHGYLGFDAPTQLTLGAGQKLSGLAVKLTRAAMLRGRVLDDDGDPVPTAWVHLLDEKREAISKAQARADGSFVLGGVQTGSYYLSVSDVPELNGVREISGPRRGHVQTYYPGAIDPAKATLIRVGTGAQIEGLNFTIVTSSVSRVRGRVVDDDGEPTAAASLEITAADRGLELSVPIEQDGSFEVLLAPPGDYLLTATRAGSPIVGDGMGRERLPVGSSDVDGVVIHMSPTLALTATIAVEGGGSAAGTRISLNPMEGWWILGGDDELDADGSHRFPRVERAVFWVDAPDRPSGTYLKSIRWGGDALKGDVLDLTHEGPGRGDPEKKLELLLSPHAAEIHGMVHEVKGGIADGAPVTLRRGGHEIDTQRTDPAGEFTFRDLAPGEYQLQLANQEAVAIRLAEDSRVTVDTFIAP